MIKISRNIKLWLFPMDGPSYPITSDEIRISKDLPSRSNEFRRSRGCLRRALANIYDMDPLKIPLSAPLGKPPRMENGFGHISLSHTKEAILMDGQLIK